MARLPVLTYPQASLKKASKDVEEFDQNWLKELIQNMFETMYAENGIGLAAPQIGENINLFVMDVMRQDPLDPENVISNQIYMINPKITEREGDIQFEEGCLSCPELLVKVDRSKDIVVESLDVLGAPQVHKLTDLEAVCTQHEMDHLKGILLTDHISRLKREMYGKKRIRQRQDEDDTSVLE